MEFYIPTTKATLDELISACNLVLKLAIRKYLSTISGIYILPCRIGDERFYVSIDVYGTKKTIISITKEKLENFFPQVLEYLQQVVDEKSTNITMKIYFNNFTYRSRYKKPNSELIGHIVKSALVASKDVREYTNDKNDKFIVGIGNKFHVVNEYTKNKLNIISMISTVYKNLDKDYSTKNYISISVF